MKVSNGKGIFLTMGIVISIILIPLLAGVVRAETRDDLFSEGIKAYENGEYQLAIDKLSKAIPLLKKDKEKIEALKTMAFAYMAFPKKKEARQQFCNILKVNPTFGLDPIMTPPKILAVFQEAKEKCLLFGGIEVKATSDDHEPISRAEVYLNGEFMGETPLLKKDILPGTYALEMRREGFRSFKAKVTIDRGVILDVNGTLMKVRISTITSIGHNVTTPLLAGDRIEVTLMGDSGKVATFDLGGVKRGLPMREVSQGRYVGTYLVGEKDRFSNLTIVGHLEDRYGARSSMKAKRSLSTSTLTRSELHFRRGKASMEQGEYDLAIDSLSKALYEDPDFVDAHILLAKAYSKKKGAYLESVKYLKNALEIDADNLEAYTLLAKMYIENGKYEDALRVVRKILRIDPDSGFAYAYMGEISYHKGRDTEAIEALRKSLQLERENPRAYFLLGKVFERRDRLADAVLEYETAVELSPTTYQYRDALAACYRALKQELSAYRQWEKCLELGDLTELERRKVRRRLSELRK